jgi:hypothetical protein
VGYDAVAGLKREQAVGLAWVCQQVIDDIILNFFRHRFKFKNPSRILTNYILIKFR